MKKLIFSLLALSLLSAAALAQSSTGNLVGTVSDASGVIQNATVVVRDNKTGRERTVQSNDSGGFTVPDLDVGTYTVTIASAGHKTHTATEVKIDVGKEYSLTATLEVGNVTENVTVVAGVDVINTSNSEIATNIGPRQLLELPLLTRNPLALILTTPGTASNPSQNTSINGQRTSSTNIVRDGVNINDNFIRSNATDFAPQRPSVDDIGEFTIGSQNGADAGFGAAQLTLATPRGQNDFHGALFEYNRNSKFAANSFFNNALGTFGPNDSLVVAGLKKVGEARSPRPFRNRNQFGGKVSGPIWKNRLYFFQYYEGLRDRVSSNKLTTTLMPAALAGRFTYTVSCLGTPASPCPPGIQPGQAVSVNLLNIPLTNISTNQLPNGIGQIDPTVQSRILSRLPLGNTTESGDGRNTTGFRFSQKQNQDRNAYTTRVDFDINSNHSINGVYNWVKEDNLRADIDNAFNLIPVVVQPSKNNFLALGYRSTLSPKLTNELTGGFLHTTPTFNRTEARPAAFIIPTLVTNPEVTFLDQGRTVMTTNVQDNATYIRGNHSLRVGGQFQNVDIEAFNDAGTNATYNLGTNTNTPQIVTSQFNDAALFPGGVPTAQRAGANSLLALLGGIVSTASQGFNVESASSGFVPGATQLRPFNFQNYGLYFSDQWRATPSLTLNLGLRYDYQTPLKLTNGLYLEPIIAPGRTAKETVLDPNGAFQFIGGNARGINAFYKPDRNNFSPVIGIAWSPHFKGGFFGKLFGDGQTVIRGGFRMDYVNDELVRAPDNALANNSGLNLTSNLLNPATQTTLLNDRASNLRSIPVPTFVANRTFLQNNLDGARQAAAFAVDPNIQVPRSTEYSIGIQREIGFNSVLEVRYVGSRSSNMFRVLDYNQVDIRTNGFAEDFNRAVNNCRLQGATQAGTGNPLFRCTSIAFNAAIPGSVPLTVFPNLVLTGGLSLSGATTLSNVQGGTPADLAVQYIINNQAGTVKFSPNPSIFVADELFNGAFFRYHSLQAELRRRFSGGLWISANYTFEKNLTNGQGTAQGRVEPFLDNLRPELEISRADFDQAHVFNLSTIYELPFGRGKRWLSDGNWLDRLVGGWQVTSIMRWSSGAPISLVDARGTLNRAARSGRQTALTSLTKDEIKALSGVFVTPNGIFFINPSAVNRNSDGSLGTGQTGRGANGFDTTFAGQVFFNNNPGTTSGLERAFLNGPTTFNLDSSVLKNIRITERVRIQLRGEFFNVLNHTQFSDPGQFVSINSTNFGRISGLATAARISQFAIRVEF
ncbi:MAG: TonB-dependent receptor [Pyrinomonadaceae bacterium]